MLGGTESLTSGCQCEKSLTPSSPQPAGTVFLRVTRDCPARPARGTGLRRDRAPAPGLSGPRKTIRSPTLLYETSTKLYASSMATMNISAARDNLPDAVEKARTEAVFLERYGHPAGVLVSPARYEQLLAVEEDAEDVAAFDAAMNEEGPNIPWAQVKADLGWT